MTINMNATNRTGLDGDGQPYPETLLARKVALEILGQVLTRKIPLDQSLDAHAEFAMLPVRDRAFARMLVATTLRRLGQVDDLIARASDRATLPQPPLLHHLLRMGVAQLVFMNVPDHAAVNTSVELAESSGMGRQKGFVNAILRRIIRDGQGWFNAQDETRLNTPDWLLQAWVADYGLTGAAEIGEANLAEAKLDISVKNISQTGYWAEALEAAILPTGSLRREAGGNVQDLPGFGEGMWWVQDASAAIPARLFGDLDGRQVIDLCAAPGGKTAQLAARGAQVIALDRSAKRLHRLEENMRRLRLDPRVAILAADASVWVPQEKASAVLMDAPCTATGTVRRHPDVMALKTPQDQANLADLQRRMLDNAVNIVAPGGTLIYCTCSLQKEEGERQIDAFLKRHKGVFTRNPVSVAELGGLEDSITADGDVRILPQYLAALGGMDGFFISRLIRAS